MDFKGVIVVVALVVIVWVLDLKTVLQSLFQTTNTATTPKLSDTPLSGSWVMPSTPQSTTDASQSPAIPSPANGTKLVRYLKLWNDDGVILGNQDVAAYNGTHTCTHLYRKNVCM